MGDGQSIAIATTVLRVAEAFFVATAVLLGISYMTGQAPLDAQSGLLVPLLVTFTVLIAVQLTAYQGVLTFAGLRPTMWRIAFDAVLGFALAVIATGVLAKSEIVQIYPYRWQWTFGLTGVWLLCLLARRSVATQMAENGLMARRIVAVTDATGNKRLQDLMQRVRGRFVVAAHVHDDDAVSAKDLATLALRMHAPEIVVCTPDHIGDASGLARLNAISVVDFEKFYERETGQVCLSDDFRMNAGRSAESVAARILKRSFDIVVALLGIAASAPVMVLAGIAVRIGDGKPVLFRQTRVGLNGQEFTLYKFRSMRVDAEQGCAPQWAAENDPRITRVGAILRRFRIDELPQFYNVLRGDMSFVGPRPERPYFVDQLADAIPHYSARHNVKPGITGWAQVSFRYGASFEDACEKTAYDLYYVKHQSTLLDIVILARTVKVIFWPHGVR